jgi:DUF4097 and DUF4098 domain-containing protein YvlB
MTNWEFPGSDPIDVVINIPAGSVAVSGEPTDVTTVDLEASKHTRNAEQLISQIQVSFHDGRLEVIQPQASGFLRGNAGMDLTVKVPAGSRCTVRTASADVACVGDLAELGAKTASGDLTAASVSGPLEVTTASGDVWLDKAGAAVLVHTASGDVRLQQAGGDVSVTTASGDVSVGTTAASVHASTASGDIRISSATRGEVNLKTVSGDCTVGVAAGTEAYLDLSSVTGRIRSKLQDSDGGNGAGLEVRCRSVSGDIKIARATVAADQ